MQEANAISAQVYKVIWLLYTSELHIQEKEFFFSLIFWTLPWSFVPQCLKAIDKLEGIHRNVPKLSKIL